jgi:hypothetical protein
MGGSGLVGSTDDGGESRNGKAGGYLHKLKMYGANGVCCTTAYTRLIG